MVSWEVLQSRQESVVRDLLVEVSIEWQTVLRLGQPGVLVGEAPGLKVLADWRLEAHFQKCLIRIGLLREKLVSPLNA